VVVLRAAVSYHDLMGNKTPRKSIPFDKPATYQISVQGRIDSSWSDRLEGMAICLVTTKASSPITTLTGEVSDQAALVGVLDTLYELHLPLLSVKRLDE
jgi:hypothetical protein